MDNILDENIIKELFKECLEHIQSGGLYAIPEILIFVSKIASKVDQDLLHEFLHLAKASVFDLRRNVQFWLAFSGKFHFFFNLCLFDIRIYFE
jgi:hypothetical protein